MLATLPLGAAEFRGRVFDSSTLAGLDGAVVTLDAQPADGTPEFTAGADVFGFFTITNIPAGDFQVTATHPGYTPSQTNETFAVNTSLSRNLPLTRLAGDPSRFNIVVEVACVKSGLRLGNVPVRAERFLTDNATTNEEMRTIFTDSLGRAIFRGSLSGHYEFRVNHSSDGANRPRWEFHGPTVRKRLFGPHFMQTLLKPIGQDMTIRVIGFDPTMGPVGLSDQPLKNVYVELEGVDPSNVSESLLPVRVGVTDAAGETKFTDLPAIAWRIVPKRMGYNPTTNFIVPSFSGTLDPSTDVPLDVAIAGFGVLFDSPYSSLAMMTGLVMRIEGLTNSNTEGITRTVPSFLFDPPGPPPPFVGALGPGLIAGRYEVTVTGLVQSAAIKSGAFNTTGRFEAVFTGRDIVELAPDVMTTRTLSVQPEPAKVRVRFYTADGMSEFPVPNATGAFTNRPAYARTSLDPALFKESSVLNQLKPEQRIVMFGTDESGERVVNLLPGVYGVEAPLLFEYFGSEARLRDVTTGEELVHGWPFAVNPDAGPPFPMSPHHALGLRFSSGHEYELDLFARAKLYDVRGEVKPATADPFSQRIVALSGFNFIATRFTDLIDGGMATLAGHPPSQPLTIMSELVTNPAVTAPNAAFAFEDVEVGTRSLTLSHPRNTFTAHSGGSSLSVTLPDWGPPGIVDMGDAADAAAGVFPLQTKWLQGAGGAPAFTATMPVAADTVRVHYYRWNTNSGGFYESEPDAVSPNYFIADPEPGSILSRYAGASRFTMGARVWDLYFAFSETNWFRTTLTATNTGYQHVRNAYIFGPSNNIITPIIESFALTVRAESDADSGLAVSNVTVTLAGGVARTAPYTTNSYSGSFQPAHVTHATWVMTNYTVTATTPKDFVLTLKMRRGMGVSGLVLDATNTAPITNAQVKLFDRFGTLLRTTNSGTNGAFVFAAVSNAQPIFLEMAVPGYVQRRVRHAPTEAVLDIASTNYLVPIPQPRILTNEVNRYGRFLPRVRKAGDTGNYTDFNAADALTMHWRMLAEEHSFHLVLPEFDSPSGGTRGVSATVTDVITETWLVGGRGFAGNPYETTSTNLVLPPTNNATAIRAWLDDVRRGTYGQVFVRRVAGRAPEPLPGTNVEVRANQPLWELPPDEFRPVFVTFTQRGSAALRELTYSAAETNKVLRGEALPQWLAFAADILGFVAGVQAATGVDVTSDQVERFMPPGRFSALPKFTANIMTNEGFMGYLYGLDVAWNEGQGTPRSGFLALAPRKLGLEFGAGLQFGLEGLSDRFFLGASASISGKTNLNYLLPSGIDDTIKTSGGFTVIAGTAGAQSYRSNHLSLLEVVNHVGGNLEGTVLINARPITGKIPYVGPALLALDKSEALRIYAKITGGVGLVVTNHWRTEFPQSFYTLDGSGMVNTNLDKNARRHFLGGREDLSEFNPVITAENSLKLCFRFGVGAEIQVANNRVNGSLLLALQGNPCGGLDSVSITPNNFGDWPPVKHIAGALNLSAVLTVDAYAAQFEFELLNKDLLTFEHQFGTETVSTLHEMSEIFTVLSPANGIPGVFVSTGPDRIRNFYRPGSTAPSAAGDGLAYTDIDPNTHEMVLRLVGTDCAGDATPVQVASAPGIVSVATTRLPSGGWLAAWSELAASDIGNAYAPSVIKYSLSGTNCTNWSAPVAIATLPDVATDLRFVMSGTLTGLVWLHAAEGPLSLRRGVSGATWNGATWSPASELLSTRNIAQFDAAGSGTSVTPPALIAWSDNAGTLHSLTWNGTATTGPHTVATDASSALDLDVNSSGEFHLAWNSISGDVRLSRFNGVSAWTLLGTPANETIASELQLAALAHGGSNTWMLAWIDGADATSLHYAVASASGATLKTNTQVAFADTGRYSHLHLQPQPGFTARLIARHTGTNNVTNLREFTVTPAGIAPWLLNASLSGGGVQFDLLASPNQTFRLQGSSNLVDWLDLLNFTATNSPVILQDNSSLPHRFYRAVSP